MATKDQLIDEVAALKAKIAELEGEKAGFSAGVHSETDSLGMALKDGAVYVMGDGGLEIQEDVVAGGTYLFGDDGALVPWVPRVPGDEDGLLPGHMYHYSGGLNDEGELTLGSTYTWTLDGFQPASADGGEPQTLADAWLKETGLRLAMMPDDGGYVLTDTTGTPMFVTYTQPGHPAQDADAAADRVKIAALEADVQALKIANAELRAENAKLRDPSLHGRVDQLKAPY